MKRYLVTIQWLGKIIMNDDMSEEEFMNSGIDEYNDDEYTTNISEYTTDNDDMLDNVEFPF